MTCSYVKKPSLAQKLVAEIIYLNPQGPEDVQNAVLRVQDMLEADEEPLGAVTVAVMAALVVVILFVCYWSTSKGIL